MTMSPVDFLPVLIYAWSIICQRPLAATVLSAEIAVHVTSNEAPDGRFGIQTVIHHIMGAHSNFAMLPGGIATGLGRLILEHALNDSRVRRVAIAKTIRSSIHGVQLDGARLHQLAAIHLAPAQPGSTQLNPDEPTQPQLTAPHRS